jgi:GntR family transcriptional regulator, transcriptional repressor for pyruvate dehydrogenase complex
VAGRDAASLRIVARRVTWIKWASGSRAKIVSTVLKPIEKQRVAEEIVEQLRSLILTGQYAPGDKLPPERNLAKELGVNRSSLREALKKLEHMGLVKIRQGDGTRVQDFMQTGGLDLVSHLIPLARSGHVELLRDVLEFRRIYGREVARLAADRCVEADLEALKVIADATDEATTGEQVLQLDFDFYVVLTRAAHNRVFALLINNTRAAVMTYSSFFVAFNVSSDAVRRHHRALIKALAKRDAEMAARIADTYLAGGAEHLLSLSQASGATEEKEAQ